MRVPSTTPTIGELFSRQYLERGAPLPDSPEFRLRLEAFLFASHHAEYYQLARYLLLEAGYVVQPWSNGLNSGWDFRGFFVSSRTDVVLSSITLVWRYLKQVHRQSAYVGGRVVDAFPRAVAWREFVGRVLREENVGYRVDEECGIHFFVDAEFESNRATALACLSNDRHAAVRAAFEAAHAYLDATPPDTKASVRSSFESLEILARLLAPPSRNLNQWLMENRIKPLVISSASNPIDAEVLGKAVDGLACLVDGLHLFRHGQATEEPVAPSIETAVYVAASVAAALRLLVPVDLAQRAGVE